MECDPDGAVDEELLKASSRGKDRGQRPLGVRWTVVAMALLAEVFAPWGHLNAPYPTVTAMV